MADENGSWHKMSQDDTMAKNWTDVHANQQFKTCSDETREHLCEHSLKAARQLTGTKTMVSFVKDTTVNTAKCECDTHFPIKCHPCSSIWQMHTRRFPVWRISLSVWELNVEKLIDMQKHAAQTGSAVIIGVCGEEVWRRLPHTNGSAHVHEAHKHTDTLTPATGMSRARWVTPAWPKSCQNPSALPSA